MATPPTWQEQIKWNADQLVAAIAQDYQSGKILMMAWMNPESLRLTVAEKVAVYWSRSRQQLWRKGETSGHTQKVHAIRLDCDGDTLLLQVEQLGGIACHTGRESCFYNLYDWEKNDWRITDPVVKDPNEIYSNP